MSTVYRSSITGRYVTKAYADANPHTTYAHTVEADVIEELLNAYFSTPEGQDYLRNLRSSLPEVFG